MFTGLIEEVGEIQGIRRGQRSCVLTIGCKTVLENTKIGDSIAVNGVCLTVTTLGGSYYTADVMSETMSRSSLGMLSEGAKVNLERAMPADGRFGGHIVSGHIDGTGTVEAIRPDDNAVWYTIAAEKGVMRYIVEKGSVAIDGISLTVAKVQEERFSVSVIPHTREKTILSRKKAGDIVNLENDVIGKYVEKLLQTPDTEKKPSNISKEFLLKNGF